MKTAFSVLISMATLAFPLANFAQQETPVTTDPTTVEMPKLEVLADRPWTYAEIPGCQILSMSDRKKTASFANLILDQELFFANLAPILRRPGAHHLAFTAVINSTAFDKLHATRPEAFQFLKHTKLDIGGDMQAFFYGSPPDKKSDDHDRSVGLFTITYRSRLLEMHRALPEWYKRGLLDCGINIHTDPDTLERRIVAAHTLRQSTADTVKRTDKNTAAQPTPLWPLARFLTTTRPDPAIRHIGYRTDDDLIYHDQCPLFLHWGLIGGGKQQREAFHHFVAAACEQTITEALFQNCFGFDFAEGDRRLLNFATTLVRHAESQRPHHRPSVKYLSLIASPAEYDFLLTEPLRKKKPNNNIAARPATASEKLRILGESYLWSVIAPTDKTARRHTIDDLQNPQTKPADSSSFDAAKAKDHTALLEKAKTLLHRLYDSGTRDAPLSAVLGSFELRLGNSTRAETFLNEAAAAHVPRPIVYVDLARLKLEQALAGKNGESTPPSAEQLQEIRALLREALQLYPEMPHALDLLALSWSYTDDVPASDDLTLLIRSVRWFPERTRSTQEIAKLCERAGRIEDAVTLARIGLDWLPPHSPSRHKTEPLRPSTSPDTPTPARP